MNDNQVMALRIRWWRMHEQRLAINSWGSGLNGGGCMNDNQFMGLRIRLDDRGCMNRARQSNRRVSDSMVDDACMAIDSWGSK